MFSICKTGLCSASRMLNYILLNFPKESFLRKSDKIKKKLLFEQFWNRYSVDFLNSASPYFFLLGGRKIVSLEWKYLCLNENHCLLSRYFDDLLINFDLILFITFFHFEIGTLRKLLFLQENLYVLPKSNTEIFSC